MKYGSAFLNSSGGVLYVGVSDDGIYISISGSCIVVVKKWGMGGLSVWYNKGHNVEVAVSYRVFSSST